MTSANPCPSSAANSFIRSTTSRRGLMLGGIGLSVAAVTGCGESGKGDAPKSSARSSGATPGQQLAKKSEIPVGGGKIIESARVVVTQPSAGNFAAVSAVCTHEGCLVRSVAGGVITCPCHGSEFALDGTVKTGPAKKPLPSVPVTTTGDSVTAA